MYVHSLALKRQKSGRRPSLNAVQKTAPVRTVPYHQTLTLHDLTLVSSSWLIGVLLFLNLPNHELKGFGNILIVPCACFCVSTVEFLSQSFAVLDGDLALVRTQVTLVSNNNDGNPFRALEWLGVWKGRLLMVKMDLPDDSVFCL